jgi:hypothetical protein
MEILNIDNKGQLNDYLVDAEYQTNTIFTYENKTYKLLLDKHKSFFIEYGEDNISQCDGYNLKFFIENGLITELKEYPLTKVK